MKQYIDKSALAAEIKRRKNLCKKIFLDLRTQENKDYYQGKSEAYKEMITFLDTLEVKETDLDKEFDRYCDNLYLIDLENEPYAELFECAKHFFELGLKAKGE